MISVERRKLYHKEEYDKRWSIMINSDLGMTTQDMKNFKVINFENEEIHEVRVEASYGKVIEAECDCGDFTHRGLAPCKHILFVVDNYSRYKTIGSELYYNVLDKFNK